MLGPIVGHEAIFVICLDEAELEEERIIFRLLHAPGLPRGMTVARKSSWSSMGATAGLSMVKAPPLRLGEREAARL